MLSGSRDTDAERESAAAFGIEIEVEDESFDVWPENWDTAMIFASMLTQWSVGPGGPVGLRYEALPIVLRLRGIPRAEWSELFEGIRVMESEALKYFAEQRA